MLFQRWLRVSALALLLITATACSPQKSKPTVPVSNELTGEYAVVDLRTGAVKNLNSAPSDLLSNNAYKTTKLVLKRIASGTFDMGDEDGDGSSRERPVHSVRISEPYYIGVFELTQGQWSAAMGSQPSQFSTKGETRPVESISWNDIRGGAGLTATLSQLTGLDFDLPTEAQWEYACKAGEHSENCGCYLDLLHLYDAKMWYSANANAETHPVGLKRPNAFGLYDTRGNVWEWCRDRYVSPSDTEPSYYALCQQAGTAIDPSGSDSGADRIVRGGGWGNGATYCRASSRSWRSPNSQASSVGVRLVAVQKRAAQIASVAPETAAVGQLYSYALDVTGSPAPEIRVTGLPSWLIYNPFSRIISGTPTRDNIGATATIAVAASNGVEADAVQMFSIVVEVWINTSGSVIVSGELSSLDGAVLRLMDGMTISASCVITSGMYALTVRPGNYVYNITYPNYFLTVTTPAGGNISVGTTDVMQDVYIETTAVGYFKASKTGSYDSFGISVAINGDTMVVGDYADDAFVFVRSGGVWSQQAYLKASNTDVGDYFGCSVAISGDTIVVGARGEDSNATGINGDSLDNSKSYSGAAYVFVRNAGVWSQQAYLKASNTGADDSFGNSVAISGDTIVVGARGEDSNATGINGNQLNNSTMGSGAAYVFVRNGGVWYQQAYLKASNTGWIDDFGFSVAISGDTIVVGAYVERSNATGVNGEQSNNSADASGAAYVFVRKKSIWSQYWSQQAYLKASNTDSMDFFGFSVAISGDTIVVGAVNESSYATGINGDESDNSAYRSGAAYVFVRTGTGWSQQAYLKASNTENGDQFGISVAISGDTIVVGAYGEASNATGINGNQSDNSAPESGAAYVFIRNVSVWSQQAYLKASNTGKEDYFGWPVAISGDTIVVGAFNEDSSATGINGNLSDNTVHNSGAAYMYQNP